MYVQLYALKNATIKDILEKLFKHYFPTYIYVETVQTFHGSQFFTEKWVNKLKKANIKLYYQVHSGTNRTFFVQNYLQLLYGNLLE